jgi:general secretion pathway protein D
MLPALVFVLFLFGCAGDMAYREGRKLIEEGKTEEGVAQLEKAVRIAPDDHKIKSYYFRQRESLINQLLRKADAARNAAKYDDAESLYRRILEIHPGNDRAGASIEAIIAAKRHKIFFVDAQGLFDKGNVVGSREKLHIILAENPKHSDARELMRRIEEKSAEERIASPVLKSSMSKPVTLEFRDASLNAVLEVISRTAGINFMLDKDVRPDIKITIFLRNTTIEHAIQFLLVTNQLEKRVLNENTLLIYPNTLAKNKDYQELIIRSFYLSNADVKQTANMIKALVKTKDLFVDEKLNMLVVRDTQEAMRLVEKLIALQDLAEPEVSLAVEVLEVSSNRLTELGIKYPSQVSYGVAGAAGVSGRLTLNEFKNPTADMVNVAVTDRFLIANFLEQDGNTNLLANPQIRVKNREKAKIHIGDRVPVITSTSTSTGFVSESVSYLDVGLKLDVEPDISLAEEVTIKIGLEVSNIVNEVTSKNGTLTYRVGTRNASTMLRLKDGETQILAGLISDEERGSADKVPGLGDLPVLGRLFSSHKDTKNKSEIVLLVTPHIVRNIKRPDVGTTEFVFGTESSVGSASMNNKQANKNTSATVADNTSVEPKPEAGSETPQVPLLPQQQILPDSTGRTAPPDAVVPTPSEKSSVRLQQEAVSPASGVVAP